MVWFAMYVVVEGRVIVYRILQKTRISVLDYLGDEVR